MSPIIIQAIGFVGGLFFIISYQIKSNKMLFLLQLLGTATFCCQFLLLGATSGAVNLIGIIVLAHIRCADRLMVLYAFGQNN